MMEYYPSYILPHANWHAIRNSELHSTFGHHHLIRLKRKDDGIKQAFQSQQFVTGLSTCLLSTRYKKRDAHWKFEQKQYGDYWNGRMEYIMPRKGLHAYSWDGEQEFYAINIAKLCRIRIDRKGLNTKGLPDKTKEICFTIQHTPTRGNFWHCDVFLSAVFFDGSSLILNDSQTEVEEKTIKKIGQIIRDMVFNSSFLIAKNKLRTHHINRHAYTTE